MYSTGHAPFIDHYVNQFINEESISELYKLSADYVKEHKRIDASRTARDAAAHIHKRNTGEDVKNTPRDEAIQVDITYKAKALEIAKRHAEAEGVPFKEWVEPDVKKTIEQKPIVREEQAPPEDHAKTAAKIFLEAEKAKKAKELLEKFEQTKQETLGINL